MFYLELNKEFPSMFPLQSNNVTSHSLVTLFSLMQQVSESVSSLMTRTSVLSEIACLMYEHGKVKMKIGVFC